jgi:hypothetical protein
VLTARKIDGLCMQLSFFPLKHTQFKILGNRQWVKLATKGSTPSPRNVQSCGRIQGDGAIPDKLYVFGGGGVGQDPVPDAGVYCLVLGGVNFEERMLLGFASRLHMGGALF